MLRPQDRKVRCCQPRNSTTTWPRTTSLEAALELCICAATYEMVHTGLHQRRHEGTVKADGDE